MPKEKFKEKVLTLVKMIPKGKVMTYKEIAKRAGYPRAWRAVGNILRHSAEFSQNHKNRNPKIPCHRVIRSDGKVGGYFYGTKKKISLLKKEGVIIKNQRVNYNFN